MKSTVKILLGLLFFNATNLYCQDTVSGSENLLKTNSFLNGFIRGSLYSGIDHENNDKPYISSGLSDIGLMINTGNGKNFRAFADLRFRYGAEFQEPVNSFDLHEAYVNVNGNKWNISAGQKIIKWGRADFTNPTSKFSPQNTIIRSPDKEDMNMGNILTSFSFYPSEHIDFTAVAVPFYRASVLIIEPLPLPDYIIINQINSLITTPEMFSYGLKAGFHLRGIDCGLMWFNGFDPMPGIALSGFDLDMSGSAPVPAVKLSETPYKIQVIGIDFETSSGAFGFRGESAISVPSLSYKTYEYVPMPEVKWVGGVDWSSGKWRITGEYSGKYITDYTPSAISPVIGSETDYSLLASLVLVPGFDPSEYIRQQVAAFNRLYNYQLSEFSHAGSLRIETDLLYGRLLPSLFTMYNFTSHDFMILPEIRFKPSDGLTVSAGAELYKGIKSSLYDIIDGFMNSVFISLRVDF